MIAFQLDQCLDSKRFARTCAAEGQCQTIRLPPSLRDADDPALLGGLMAQPNPLITFDRALPHDHTASIPDRNPGIIVVSNFPEPQTMTIRIAQRVLRQFKSAFPQWPAISWSNSIVEITTIGVEAWHVEQGRLARDGYFAFDAGDWQDGLRQTLIKNSSATTTPKQ